MLKFLKLLSGLFKMLAYNNAHNFGTYLYTKSLLSISYRLPSMTINECTKSMGQYGF